MESNRYIWDKEPSNLQTSKNIRITISNVQNAASGQYVPVNHKGNVPVLFINTSPVFL